LSNIFNITISSCKKFLNNILSKYENYLQENNSELLNLRSGDKYHLHDPTLNEVLEFLKSNEKEIDDFLEILKNRGVFIER